MIRSRIVVKGIVQGVGFRPFIHRIAHDHGLNGWVLNSTEGVVIEVEGTDSEVKSFICDITEKAPPLAVIERLESVVLPPVGYNSFEIESSRDSTTGFALVSPDICICEDCRRELFDPTDRRYRYPFINCTNCGPRFTIVEDIPYDRPKTTMKYFPMCPTCQAEYGEPTNRRFHAQPNACPDCGPQVWLQANPLLATKGSSPVLARGDDAIREARRLLSEGAILAVKGLGGFHLACDASSDSAVGLLRERKQRVDKPFAVMSTNADTVSVYCHLSISERQLLESPQRPIVLLRSKEDGPLSRFVAPGNRFLGVMLPYTPLHYLLLADGNGEDPVPRALVMTSGNMSEEPLAIDNDEALEQLAPLADCFLMHDRDIHIRCDDSVTRLHGGREMISRRSRGYAPFPVRLRLPEPKETLACGAELKNTFCLARSHYAFLSQHVGDLQNYETLRSYEESIEHFKALFRVNPTLVAHDMHPDYMSTHYALALDARSSGAVQRVPVQHHEAHIASCMAENELYEPVIGVAFDGTGFGRDGKIWGGEFFTGEYHSFQRVAHLSYVPMPGGEAAIKRPARMALSHLYNAVGADFRARSIPFADRLSDGEVKLIILQLERGLNTPLTSSVGRLFDAVSAMIGVRDQVNYEGQAAIEMEMLADGDVDVMDSYEWTYEQDSCGMLIIDVASIVSAVVKDIECGRRASEIAARFHNTMASVVGDICCIISRRSGLSKVALSGGVFQNTFLLDRTINQLERRGLVPVLHHQVPANDGGISLGQVMIANAQVEN